LLKTTQDLFNYLEIKDVMVFVDLTKDEAIEKLNHLNMSAMKWHAKHWNDTEDMAILVRWIGWDIELDREEREFSERDYNPVDGNSKSFTRKGAKGAEAFKFYKFDHYGLTVQGEPLNLDSYCLRMANIDRVHVYLFQNWDKFNQVDVDDINWSCRFNELELPST